MFNYLPTKTVPTQKCLLLYLIEKNILPHRLIKDDKKPKIKLFPTHQLL
jgi:hypothetical protein